MEILIEIYVRAAAALLYLSIWLINSTLRFRVVGREGYDALKAAGRNVILAVWHQQTFIMFYFYRGRKTAIFTSHLLRGKVLTKCAEWMGYRVIPISESDTPAAMAKMVKYIKDGYDVVVAMDGPTGPIFEAKPGIYFVSVRGKLPIIPVRVDAPLKIILFWRWDKFIIPLPFSEVTIRAGKTVFPSPRIREELQAELDRLL